jgi:metallophosphoesterase (TIGR03768 family)
MVERRNFLKFSLSAIPVGASLVAGESIAGAAPQALQSNAIAPEVFTTLEHTVVPGAKPSVPIPLSAVSRFKQYGYGNWTLGNPLPAELRTDLMPASYDATTTRRKEKLLSFFTISDIHITDKETPNQLIHLGRLVESHLAISAALYSPVMMCSTQVLDAAIQTVNALHAKNPIDFGLSLGDVCNSSQYNELRWYIDVLDGKVIHPSSGAHLGADSIDYQKPFKAAGLDKSIPWYQALGNHDHFYMGSFPVDTPLRPDLRASYTSDTVFATGNVLADVNNLKEPVYYMGVLDGASPDGAIRHAGKVADFPHPPKVAPDANRRPVGTEEWMAEFFKTSSLPVGHGFTPANAKAGFACYSFVPKSTLPLKVIVLDNTQREDDGSPDIHGHGFLDLQRWNWLKAELAAGDAAGQLMVIAAHIPLAVEETNPPPVLPTGKKQSPMGWWVNPDPTAPVQNAVDLPGLIAELHRHPNLLMWLSGHRHLNTVKAFAGPTPQAGFWQVETSSLRDFPQQLRTFEIHLNSDYSISIVTTNVDPAVQEGTPAAKSRAYAIAASQIVKDGDKVDNYNPTGDPSVHFMPRGSYNAELRKQLSPEMVRVLKAKWG